MMAARKAFKAGGLAEVEEAAVEEIAMDNAIEMVKEEVAEVKVDAITLGNLPTLNIKRHPIPYLPIVTPK